MHKFRIQYLEDENKALKKEVEFLRGHPALAKGLRGEVLIADILLGSRTKNGLGHDVETTSKVAIEVKYSSLLQAWPDRPLNRWVWTKLFGELGKKSYDRLILVGDTDPKFASFYRDTSSPYVLFDLSYRDAVELVGGVKLGRAGRLYLTSNPTTVRSPRALMLFNQYQTTTEELQRRYLSHVRKS